MGKGATMKDIVQENKETKLENSSVNYGTSLYDGLMDAALVGAFQDTVQRYGGAIGEHLVGLTGIDNLRHHEWIRGLSKIADSKVHPDYEYQNIHQQAGFSAEVKSVVRQNGEARIHGDATRTMRTDDLGRVNDPLYDSVKLDEHGTMIDGTGTQIKFLGYSESDPFNEHSAARAFQKLMSDKFAKYHEHHVFIEVPKDQYEGLLVEADKKIQTLHDQLAHVTDPEVRHHLEIQLDRAEAIRQHTRQSMVTSDEAVFAREHPYLSTAQDMGHIAHTAGLQAAEFGAIIGGSMAVVQQTVALLKGEVTGKEAAINIGKSTVKRAGQSYAVGAGGTLLKGAMEQASSAGLRGSSMTGLPQAMVQVGITSSQVLYRYCTGQIDGKTCVQELSLQSANMLSASLFAGIGQVVIPIPIVGGMLGAMAGYSMSSAMFGILQQAFREEGIAINQRQEQETACAQYVAQMKAYREQFESAINTYFSHEKERFQQAFTGMQDGIKVNDTQWVLDMGNSLIARFGGTVTYKNQEEFDALMVSDESLRI